MRPLRKDEVEGNEHNLYSVVPKEVSDHPLFNKGHTVGIMTAESPRFPTHPGGNEALSADLHGLGLHHEPTHGSYGAPENSFIVHKPTREHMYTLGRKYGQEAVVYSQDGKHELLYTHGPNAGKHQESKPEMHYSPTQPKDFYTHLPGKGYVTLHFGDEMHDSPVKGTVPLEHHVAKPPLNPMERDLMRKFAKDLKDVIGRVLEKSQK
jgi:hypothetical protein